MSHLKWMDSTNLCLSSQSMHEIIDVVKCTFVNLANKTIFSPKKYTMPLPKLDDTDMKWINSMPCYLLAEQIAGIKWVTVNSGNYRCNLPTISGVIILNDLATGLPIVVCDAAMITHYRTAASITHAAKCFAPANPKTLTLIGPGMQGSYSALFLKHMFPCIETINVVGRSQSGISRFTNLFNQFNFEANIHVYDATEKAIKDSDIILLASTSSHALLSKSMINKAEVFICGLTAFMDLNIDVLDVANNIIFDDLNIAIPRLEEVSNVCFLENYHGQLHCLTQMSLGKMPSSTSKGINVYLPVGISAMDISIAHYFHKALNMI